jgi:hypothetical protein
VAPCRRRVWRPFRSALYNPAWCPRRSRDARSLGLTYIAHVIIWTFAAASPAFEEPHMLRRVDHLRWLAFAVCVAIAIWATGARSPVPNEVSQARSYPPNLHRILSKCHSLKRRPGPPPEFYTRRVSDRFEEGTPATLITNATIFTGSLNGTEVVYGGACPEA